MKSIGDLFIQISANATPALEAMTRVEHSLNGISRAAHSTEGAVKLVADQSESSFGRMASSILKLVTAYRAATFAINVYKQAATAASGVNPVTGSAFSPRTAAALGAINTQLARLGPLGKTAGAVASAAIANLGAVASRVGKIIAAFTALVIGMKVAVLALAGAVALTAAGIAGAFKSAQIKESIGAVEAIFKDSSKVVLKFADDVSNAFGRSKKSVLDASVQIGAILKSQGFTDSEAATNAITLLGTAMELAAQRGKTVQEAMVAMGAALRGEEEPIRALGITISEALVKKTIEADANLSQLAKTNDLGARAAARMILIQRQSADAFGTMAKESGNLTQQLEKFKGLLSQGFANLGTGFEPLVTAVIRLSNAFLQLGGGGITSFADAVQLLLSPVTKLVNLIASLVEGLNKLAGIAGVAPKLGGELAIPKAAPKDAEMEAFQEAQKKFAAEKEYQDRLDGLLEEMAEREKKRQADIARVREQQFQEYMDAVQQQNRLFDRRESIQNNLRRSEISSAADVFSRNLNAEMANEELKELQEINQGIKELKPITGLG
jgi:hypothetical protein